jgi:signal transduction histidine kinase
VALADEDRLVQVLVNLLSNAVKFSPKGKSVEISSQADGVWVEVRVADQGPGIPLNLRDAIFEPFFQADSADSRSQGGSGLGLAISRTMVKEFGGSMGVEDRPGGGSVFWLRVPVTGAEKTPERSLS